MKIGILGGSFNPPHYGHLLIAQQVLDFMGLDEIWLMPCFAHPFNKELLPVKERLEMVKYLETTKIKVTDFEIREKKVSYTYKTLESLCRVFPSHEFYWIIGEDQIGVFKEWKNWQELIQKNKFIVFPRQEDTNKLKEKSDNLIKENKYFENLILFTFKNVAITNISSSMIRRRIKEGHSIKYLVTKEVEDYIVKNNLYKNSE